MGEGGSVGVHDAPACSERARLLTERRVPNCVIDPISYVGDIKVQNIPNRQCNPDGNILYHRVIMAASSEPMLTWKGYAFVQQRCDPACNNLINCSS